MTESYWLAEPAEPLARVSRAGRPDVVVIGGGVTGCSCALTLAEGGLRVRVLETRRIAWGASGRNGGFAMHGLAISYRTARERFGRGTAAALWRFTERRLERMEELAGDAFRRVGSIQLAVDEELEAVRAEFEALREDGIAVEWVDKLAPPSTRSTAARSCTQPTPRSTLRAGSGGSPHMRSPPEPRSSRRAGSRRSTRSTPSRS